MDIIHSATRKQDTKFKARLRKGRNELAQVGKPGPSNKIVKETGPVWFTYLFTFVVENLSSTFSAFSTSHDGSEKQSQVRRRLLPSETGLY
jgi:hypothetical protein